MKYQECMKLLLALGTCALLCVGCNSKDTEAISKDASTLAKHTVEAASTAQLTGRVWAVLSQWKELDVKGVHIESKDGVVTLSGHVPNAKMKKLAEDTAFSIRGVEKVVNELKVEDTSK